MLYASSRQSTANWGTSLPLSITPLPSSARHGSTPWTPRASAELSRPTSLEPSCVAAKRCDECRHTMAVREERSLTSPRVRRGQGRPASTSTIGLAKEVAEEGIRVNAVRPGFIYTDLHAKAGEPKRVERVKTSVPMQRGGQPEEVAVAILWLLSNEASYVTGAILDVTGGR